MKTTWTEAQDAALRAAYPDTLSREIGEVLGRTERAVYQRAAALGLSKSFAFLSSMASARYRSGTTMSPDTQFKPGHSTWNKGMKGLDIGGKETRYQPGNKPHSWLPIGSTRISKEGISQIKVTDTGYPPRDWKAQHVVVWEQHNGPVPRGSIVVFCNRDRNDRRIENLECITRAENMHRNSLHRYPKEIALAMQAIGVLNRQINKHQRPAP